jgi:hypothetical protein
VRWFLFRAETLIAGGLLMALGLTAYAFTGDRVAEDARKIVAVMAAAHRTAVEGGQVREDVAATWGLHARAEIEIASDAVWVYRLVEAPLPSHDFSWEPVLGIKLDGGVTIAAVGAGAASTPGGALPPPLGDDQHVERYYMPEGTAEAVTLYLTRKGHDRDRYRVVGLPLAPVPQVFMGW